jgi:hypothetical protein
MGWFLSLSVSITATTVSNDNDDDDDALASTMTMTVFPPAAARSMKVWRHKIPMTHFIESCHSHPPGRSYLVSVLPLGPFVSSRYAIFKRFKRINVCAIFNIVDVGVVVATFCD